MRIKSNILLASDDSAGGGDGGGNNDAALKAAIEKARMEERTRLQGQIATLTSERDAALAAKAPQEAEIAKLKGDLATLQTSHDALKVSIKDTGGVDVEKAIASAVAAATTQFSATTKAEVDDLRTQLNTERAGRQQAELAQTRIRLIAEAGGPSVVIPELVTGNSEEALKASIENSKLVLKRSLEAAKGSGGSGTGSGTANNDSDDNQTVPIGSATGGSRASDTIRGEPKATLHTTGRMSMKEYAANRGKLRQDALGKMYKPR